MNARNLEQTARVSLACASLGLLLALSGCASDGYSGGGSTSVSVGYGYGGYYSGYYSGYYDPYPPVVVVPPGDRPDRPDSGNRPSTLPASGGGGASMAPSRPTTSSRPTSRPSPRPATRPMPRSGGRR